MHAERIRPSAAWYWVASLVAVVGLAAAVGWGALGIKGFADNINRFQRVGLPGSADVPLERGGYVLYLERPGVSESQRGIQREAVEITSANGQRVPLGAYAGTVTYRVGGHEGRAIATIQVATPGRHHVQTSGEDCSSCVIAIGRGIGLGPVRAILGGILVGFVAVLAGGITAVVTGVRRGAAKRRRERAPTGWGPGPAGTGGT